MMPPTTKVIQHDTYIYIFTHLHIHTYIHNKGVSMIDEMMAGKDMIEANIRKGFFSSYIHTYEEFMFVCMYVCMYVSYQRMRRVRWCPSDSLMPCYSLPDPCSGRLGYMVIF